MTRSPLTLTLALLAGSGCFFPEFTFDEAGAGGQGATTATTTATTTDATTDATTTGSAGGGGGTGGAGGSPPIDLEDCTNGVDDDADLDVDCADAGCATKAACVAPVPMDWTGYFALYEGPPGAFTGCPPAFPTQGYQGNADIVAPDATCSMCTCNAPTGRTCVLAPEVSTADAPCGLQSTCVGDSAVSMGWTGVCEGIGYFAGGQTTCGVNTVDCASPNTGVACNQAVTMAAASVVGGTCTPTSATSTPTKSAPTWSTLGVACGEPAMTALGCNANFTCLPRPDSAAGYVGGLCISHAGVEPCPAGIFTEQHLFYTGFTDDRDCSGCSCGASAGGSCTATVNVYSNPPNNTCTTLAATLNVTSAAAACENLTGNPNVGSHSATINPPTGGGCPPSGGTATGSGDPDPATATTFCCAS